jgi:signal transduction histidine kinase
MVGVADVGPATGSPRPARWEREAHARAHSVQFYADDGFLIDGLGRFVGAALGAGDAAIVIATTAHREALAARLAARGLDLGRAAAAGRYVALDAAETLATFMVDGQPDPTRFADQVGGVVARAAAAAAGEPARVAAFGEMVALLWAGGAPEAALALEQLWNDLAGRHSFDLHCAYPIGLFPHAADADRVARICAAHTHVTPAEDYIVLPEGVERARAIVVLQQKARALEAEVAERRRAQEALERREADLRAAVRARDEFLSIAAHELKTPVTSLRGYAQLLLRENARGRDVAPERLATALSAINVQTGRLTQLVSRLLDVGLIEAGKLRVDPVDCDLAALAREALAGQPVATGLQLVYDGPDRLVASVDPLRLEQVVTNLLDNAVKFSPAGGTVTVGLGCLDDGSVQLTVTDQGIGIPADQREAVFERFYQAHGDAHLSGFGIGLHVAREIVSLHGGCIRAEPALPQGARLVVTLPAADGSPK